MVNKKARSLGNVPLKSTKTIIPQGECLAWKN
nr:MAG TPA: hypothetical protein [Caudoviricetes sp.]